MLDMKELLAFSVEAKASDVHIAVGIPPKLRINGRLTEVEVPPLTPADAAEAIGATMKERHVAILKDRGEVDFSFDSPETGRFRVNVYMDRGNMAAAYRRVETQIPRPDQLGIPREVVELYKRKRGLVLVTGPTGSGKSTTLYTSLSELNKEDVNIITVEDPVEANINGINQVQVNNKADMTFAAALRSILRQDPDIIMIGEIRDGETAQIAVQAAITGHLVVSTLHTNSAASTITRLEDMGIEPYVVGDAVVGVIAQRLVRRLCPTCKQPRLVEDEERIVLGVPEDEEDVIIYEPSGCPLCNDTGYSGRIGVYEMMPVSKALQAVISTGATADKIEKQALAEGMLTLKMGAAKHVLNGITSMSEMKKIVYTTGDEY